MPDERYVFPGSEFGIKMLKFQISSLKAREWLVYSKKLDGAFCKYCVGFTASGAGKQGLPLADLLEPSTLTGAMHKKTLANMS